MRKYDVNVLGQKICEIEIIDHNDGTSERFQGKVDYDTIPADLRDKVGRYVRWTVLRDTEQKAVYALQSKLRSQIVQFENTLTGRLTQPRYE